MGLANRAQKLTKVGVDTPAHIDAMTSTGKTDTPGGTEYDISLTVTPAGGEAYQVTTNQYIYPSNPFARVTTSPSRSTPTTRTSS